jgi:hypothetical protein
VARKIETITITAEGRDKGKVFVLTEMPAPKVERWERRALAAMVATGVEVPDNIQAAGFGYIIAIGLKALLGLRGPEVEALHDELMSCVAYLPDPMHPEIKRAPLEFDIEEDRTIYTLKDEVIKLHAGFSIAAFLSKIWAETAAKMEKDMQTMPTSDGKSEPLSQVG